MGKFAESVAEFEKRGVTLVGISADAPGNLEIMARARGVEFPLLSDQDLAVHDRFHVTNQLTDAMFERMTGMGLDIEGWSGRGHHKVAIPSLFLIDEQQIVRWSHADRDHKIRPSVAQILAAIDEVLAAK